MPDTPLMNLELPDVSVTPGPQWASLLNSALFLVDSHDHSPGRGTPVTPSGLNINTDLPLGSNNLTQARSLRTSVNPSVLTGASDLACLFSVDEGGNGNLYWRNALGQAVRITQGSGIDATTTGGFGGDYAQPNVPAQAIYTQATTLYSFEQSPNVLADGTFDNMILGSDLTAVDGTFSGDIICDTLRANTNISSLNYEGLPGSAVDYQAGPPVGFGPGASVRLVGGQTPSGQGGPATVIGGNALTAADTNGGQANISSGASTGLGIGAVVISCAPGQAAFPTVQNSPIPIVEITGSATIGIGGNVLPAQPNVSFGTLTSRWGSCFFEGGDFTQQIITQQSLFTNLSAPVQVRGQYQVRNSIPAWATFPNSGSATPFPPTANVNVVSAAYAGGGEYNIVLARPVSVNAAILVTAISPVQNDINCEANWTSTTTIDVFVTNSGTPATSAFSILIVGEV